jgi:hypothetical protein
MGNRITQKIYECSICGKTPENGEYMWHMGNEVWCEDCCKEQEEQEFDELVKIANNK